MELVIASVLLGALAGYTIAEGVVSLVSYINRKRRRCNNTSKNIIKFSIRINLRKNKLIQNNKIR